jgi:hypothetical protein
MSNTFVNSSTVQSANYQKNDTSGMYGYLNRGYTVTVKHTNGAETQIPCKTKDGAKKVCEQAIGG